MAFRSDVISSCAAESASVVRASSSPGVCSVIIALTSHALGNSAREKRKSDQPGYPDGRLPTSSSLTQVIRVTVRRVKQNPKPVRTLSVRPD